MLHFTSIKELINLLYRERDVLNELFEKRRLQVRADDILRLADDDFDRISRLFDYSLLLQNGPLVELEDRMLDFFESILSVNEDINTTYIQENIKAVKENIFYYMEEGHSTRREGYMKRIKSDFRKMGVTVLRNILELSRNIEHVYKSEPTFSIKKKKLEVYDDKRGDIQSLIHQLYHLMEEEEKLFFKSATDEELQRILVVVKKQLKEAQHNLLEIQTQIIYYLNKIKEQSALVEHLHHVKHLKDQFELRNRSNIEEVLIAENALCLLPSPSMQIRLSLEKMEQDDVFDSIKKVNQRLKRKSQGNLLLAAALSSDDIDTHEEQEIYVDPRTIKDSFKAGRNHLFDFVMNYVYPRPMDLNEKITMYCTIISLFEDELNMTDEFRIYNNEVEYALVLPE